MWSKESIIFIQKSNAKEYDEYHLCIEIFGTSIEENLRNVRRIIRDMKFAQSVEIIRIRPQL